MLFVRTGPYETALKLVKQLGRPFAIPVRHALMKKVAGPIVPLGLLCLSAAMSQPKPERDINRCNQGHHHRNF